MPHLLVPLNNVVVGPRRRPAYNIDQLATSIRLTGLVNPVTVPRDRLLVAGRQPSPTSSACPARIRRFSAQPQSCSQLGMHGPLQLQFALWKTVGTCGSSTPRPQPGRRPPTHGGCWTATVSDCCESGHPSCAAE